MSFDVGLFLLISTNCVYMYQLWNFSTFCSTIISTLLFKFIISIWFIIWCEMDFFWYAFSAYYKWLNINFEYPKINPDYSGIFKCLVKTPNNFSARFQYYETPDVARYRVFFFSKNTLKSFLLLWNIP